MDCLGDRGVLMAIAASIGVEEMERANTDLENLGHGPGNFSIPMREGGGLATHGGLHAWDDDVFLSALNSLEYESLSIRYDPGPDVNIQNHTRDEGLEWEDPTNWTENPIMKGDIRTHGGRTWESLVDYNVWEPPVSWREVVEEGYPDWVQPTGAHDAYNLGDRVMHNDMAWESTIAANVWEPGVFGWVPVDDRG
jgi:hypothetical protein